MRSISSRSWGWDIFCDAAKQIGIGTELADRTRQSFIQVKELGLAWGGDARGFELLAAGLARVSDPRVGLEHRKIISQAAVMSGAFVRNR